MPRAIGVHGSPPAAMRSSSSVLHSSCGLHPHVRSRPASSRRAASSNSGRRRRYAEQLDRLRSVVDSDGLPVGSDRDWAVWPVLRGAGYGSAHLLCGRVPTTAPTGLTQLRERRSWIAKGGVPVDEGAQRRGVPGWHEGHTDAPFARSSRAWPSQTWAG